MSEDKSLAFQFNGIQETSVSSKITDEIVSNFSQEKVQLNLGFSLRGNPVDSTIVLAIVVKFKLKIAEKYKEFFSFSTDTIYKFKNLDDKLIKIEESEIFVDDDLMINLLSISVGATRGMMSYKVSSFPFELLLPLFDVSDILEQANNKK